MATRFGGVADRFFCFACGHDHRSGTAIGRDHKRYSIEGGHESGGIFSDLREFYLQTKGIAAALRILGFEDVRVHPPRFGRGGPPRPRSNRPIAPAPDGSTRIGAATRMNSGKCSGRSKSCVVIDRRTDERASAIFNLLGSRSRPREEAPHAHSS